MAGVHALLWRWIVPAAVDAHLMGLHLSRRYRFFGPKSRELRQLFQVGLRIHELALLFLVVHEVLVLENMQTCNRAEFCESFVYSPRYFVFVQIVVESVDVDIVGLRQLILFVVDNYPLAFLL